MIIDEATRWFQFFGRLHPMVLHLPIGLIAGLATIEIVAAVRRRPVPTEIIRLLLWLTAITAVVTAGTGYVLGEEGVNSGWTLDTHRTLGIAVAVGAVLSAVADLVVRNRAVYRLLLLVTIALIMPTGHLGASMTHGENFLTEPFTKDSSPVVTAVPSVAFPATAPAPEIGPDAYAVLIAPILAERCTACHGESRRKGGLALHNPESIIAGGEQGPILTAGKPEESEMVRRLRLPVDHNDHMPPANKPQLTAGQIDLIERWIADGVSFGLPAHAAEDGIDPAKFESKLTEANPVATTPASAPVQ